MLLTIYTEKCSINLQHTEWRRSNCGCCTSSTWSFCMKLGPLHIHSIKDLNPILWDMLWFFTFRKFWYSNSTMWIKLILVLWCLLRLSSVIKRIEMYRLQQIPANLDSSYLLLVWLQCYLTFSRVNAILLSQECNWKIFSVKLVITNCIQFY